MGSGLVSGNTYITAIKHTTDRPIHSECRKVNKNLFLIYNLICVIKNWTQWRDINIYEGSLDQKNTRTRLHSRGANSVPISRVKECATVLGLVYSFSQDVRMIRCDRVRDKHIIEPHKSRVYHNFHPKENTIYSLSDLVSSLICSLQSPAISDRTHSWGICQRQLVTLDLKYATHITHAAGRINCQIAKLG